MKKILARYASLPLVILLLCADALTTIAQDAYLMRIFQSGQYDILLDSLVNREQAECDRFFYQATRQENFEDCDYVVLNRIRATVFHERHEPLRAIESIDEANHFNSRCPSDEEEVRLGLLSGMIFRSQGKAEYALEHFLKAIRTDEKLPPSTTTFELHHFAALLHYHSGNTSECIRLLERAIRLYDDHPDFRFTAEQERNVMSTFNTIALAYRDAGEYEKAIAHFARARKKAVALGDRFWVGLTHGNTGTVYKRMAQYDSAIYHLQIDVVLSKTHRQWQSLVNSYLSLAEIAEKQSDRRTANAYYDSIGALLERHPALYALDYLKKQSEINYRRGDYKASATYYRKFLAKKDSLDRLEVAKNLRLLQSQYEFDSKLAELTVMRKDNQLKEKELVVQRGLLFGSVSTMLLLSLLIYMVGRRYNQKRRVARMLEQQISERTRELTALNEELDTFLYRASHDFRGPLATLIGLNRVGELTLRDPEAIELMAKVGEVATVMDRMLDKIAAIHIINREELNLQVVDLHAVCDEILLRLKPRLGEASMVNEVPRNLLLVTDEKLLGIALENVVENALKFRRYDGLHTVSVSAGVAGNETTIVVSDTGKGIAPQFYGRIFLPFVRADREKGNGLGLFLARKCVEKLGGKVSFTSEVGVGSVFTIVVPLVEIERTVKMHTEVIS